MSPQKRIVSLTIGSYADYLDTGIWDISNGQIVAPDDLTIRQLKDWLHISGGAVYLRHDGKLCWIHSERSNEDH